MDKQKTTKYLEDFLQVNLDEIKSIYYRYPEVGKSMLNVLEVIDKDYASGNQYDLLMEYIKS
jgi:hypothetical protein